jgi:hypothetical protein
MNKLCQLPGILLLAGIACLTGCQNGGHFELFGYTTKPTFDETIRTVYVPIPLNYSYSKNIEFELMKAVTDELNSRAGAPRITSCRERADTELVMKIVLPRKATILLNQLGEARDVEVGFNVEVVWRDLRPGHIGDILSNPKRFDPKELPLPGELPLHAPEPIPYLVTPAASYVPELGGTNLTAQTILARRAGMQIVNMMEVYRKH